MMPLFLRMENFFPVPFADAYLFVNPERAQNYIDQNDLKKDNFTVVKTFNI